MKAVSRLRHVVALPHVLREFASFLLLGALAGCVTEGEVFESPGAGGEQVASLATLYAGDPLRHTLDFETGAFGAVLQEGEVRNAGSHLDFDFYLADGFTVGIQGAERGMLVDLGDESELSMANGGQSAFASLSLSGNTFSLPAADVVFDAAQPQSAPVVAGHLYVARIDRDEEDIIVKWLAVDHTPARSVVIDWVRLR